MFFVVAITLTFFTFPIRAIFKWISDTHPLNNIAFSCSSFRLCDLERLLLLLAGLHARLLRLPCTSVPLLGYWLHLWTCLLELTNHIYCAATKLTIPPFSCLRVPILYMHCQEGGVLVLIIQHNAAEPLPLCVG